MLASGLPLSISDPQISKRRVRSRTLKLRQVGSVSLTLMKEESMYGVQSTLCTKISESPRILVRTMRMSYSYCTTVIVGVGVLILSDYSGVRRD